MINHIQDNEMDGVCDTHDTDDNCIKDCGPKICSEGSTLEMGVYY